MTGKIKTLKAGYGFIAREGSTDLFFHAKNLIGVGFEDLQLGDELSFEVQEADKNDPRSKGDAAINVQRA